MPPAVVSQPEGRQLQALTRLRWSATIVLCVVPVSAVVNFWLFSDHAIDRTAAFSLEIGVCVVALVLSARPWAQSYAIPLSLGFAILLSAAFLWLLSMSPIGLEILVGTIVATMVGAPLIFPWGPLPQVLLSAFLSVGYASLLPWGALDAPHVVNIGIALATGITVSIVGALILDRQRTANARLVRDLNEAGQQQRIEAQISAAIAHVGREMIASLSMPVTLERLCAVTNELLGCDASHTLLWQAESEAFLPIAMYGETAENEERLRVLRFTRPMLTLLLDKFETDDVVEFVLPSFDRPETVLGHQMGYKVIAHIALRRGENLIGIQSACYRECRDGLGAERERIAHGIGKIASMAIENARLASELESAMQLKSEFVATMSHELRTPLNVIVGYGELLLEGEFGQLAVEQAGIVQRLTRNAKRLHELINATLDLGRLEAGRLPLNLEKISLADLVRTVVVETGELHEKPGVDLVWHVAPDLGTIETDPLKLKVVLKNLVSNALKFTEKGTVAVSAISSDDVVEIAVRDTGIGIEAEALAIIFEPFRQAGTSQTRRHDGVGLGLYIARRLVDVLDGSIAVETTPGAGSVFHVRLAMRRTRRMPPDLKQDFARPHPRLSNLLTE